LAIFGFDNDRRDVVIFDGLADVVGELAGRVLRGIKLSPTSTFKQDAAELSPNLGDERGQAAAA
jgi:hypothetical protein